MEARLPGDPAGTRLRSNRNLSLSPEALRPRLSTGLPLQALILYQRLHAYFSGDLLATSTYFREPRQRGTGMEPQVIPNNPRLDYPGNLIIDKKRHFQPRTSLRLETSPSIKLTLEKRLGHI